MSLEKLRVEREKQKLDIQTKILNSLPEEDSAFDGDDVVFVTVVENGNASAFVLYKTYEAYWALISSMSTDTDSFSRITWNQVVKTILHKVMSRNPTSVEVSMWRVKSWAEIDAEADDAESDAEADAETPLSIETNRPQQCKVPLDRSLSFTHICVLQAGHDDMHLTYGLGWQTIRYGERLEG